MRFAPWLCGLHLLLVSAAHAEISAASFNHNTAAGISGLIGGTGLSETGLKLDTVSGNVNFEKLLLSNDDELVLSNNDELVLSDDKENPSEAFPDVTSRNDVPEPTPFILVGIFLASFFLGRKFRVKSA